MSSSVSETLFAAVEKKLQTARKSYAKYISIMEELNQLLKDMVDYAIKNNWNLHELSDNVIEGYLYEGNPKINVVMEKLIEAFGEPEEN